MLEVHKAQRNVYMHLDTYKVNKIKGGGGGELECLQNGKRPGEISQKKS